MLEKEDNIINKIVSDSSSSPSVPKADNMATPTISNPKNDYTYNLPKNDNTHYHTKNDYTYNHPKNDNTLYHPKNDKTLHHSQNEYTTPLFKNENTIPHPMNNYTFLHPINNYTHHHTKNDNTYHHSKNNHTHHLSPDAYTVPHPEIDYTIPNQKINYIFSTEKNDKNSFYTTNNNLRQNSTNVNTEKKNFIETKPIYECESKLPIFPIHYTKFSGTNNEDYEDWKRQFKCLLRYANIKKTDIYYFAASLLTGEAGRYLDNLKEEPDNFYDFIKAMDKRFGQAKMDKPQTYKNFLSKQQSKEENLIEYTHAMIKLGEDAGMDEIFIFQTIISNMTKTNRVLLRIHMKNEFTIKQLVEILQFENDAENRQQNIPEEHDINKKYEKFNNNKSNSYYLKNNEENQETLEDIYDRLKVMTTQSHNSNQYKEKYARNQPFCTKCNRNGHYYQNCITNIQKKDNNLHEDVTEKIRKIENKIDKKITGSLFDLKKDLNLDFEKLNKHFEIFPASFKAYTTLRKNETFVDNIL
ncbi:hypothetical protein GVAV_001563 [Gurleya vavrai]